jgi:short-chain fatty acids transporter
VGDRRAGPDLHGAVLHASAEPLNAINLNILNLGFLLLAFLLHGTPSRHMHAVAAATSSVWGVILQFPFYAGIAGVITATGLSDQLSHLFVQVSTRTSYPP